MHTGKDGRYSQRSVLGTIGFLGHMLLSAWGCYKQPELTPAILYGNAGLIAFLIGAKTWQNQQEYKIDNGSKP